MVLGAPTLSLLYDPAVTRYLGSRLILQSLAPLRGSTSSARFSEVRVDDGAIVEVTTRNPSGVPTVDKYFALRRRGLWVIRYDSVLATQIGQLAQNASSPAGAPSPEGVPSEEAVLAGENAKDAIVDRFVPESLIDRLIAP